MVQNSREVPINIARKFQIIYDIKVTKGFLYWKNKTRVTGPHIVRSSHPSGNNGVHLLNLLENLPRVTRFRWRRSQWTRLSINYIDGSIVVFPHRHPFPPTMQYIAAQRTRVTCLICTIFARLATVCRRIDDLWCQSSHHIQIYMYVRANNFSPFHLSECESKRTRSSGVNSPALTIKRLSKYAPHMIVSDMLYRAHRDGNYRLNVIGCYCA